MKSPFSEPSGLKRTSWKKYFPSPDSFDFRRKRAGMTRSVSMFGRSMGTAPAVSLVKASMISPSLLSPRLVARGERLGSNCGPLPWRGRGMQSADVGELAGNGRRRSHGGAHEMRAGALALAPLEIAVGGGGDALALARSVAVHSHAHGAAWIAPLEPRRREDLVQPLGLRGLLDESRAGDDPCLDHRAPPLCDGGRRAQILEAAVGARADEDAVDLDLGQRRARAEAHVVDGAPHGLTSRRVRLARGIGHAPRNGQRVLGTGAPRHGGQDVGAVERDFLVERGVRIRGSVFQYASA